MDGSFPIEKLHNNIPVQSADEEKDPVIVRWSLDVYINGEKDTTWQFTSNEDIEAFKSQMQKDNPEAEVTFSEPQEVIEKMPTE